MNNSRKELLEIVKDEMNSPMRIMGATVAFLKIVGKTNFERSLAKKLDEMIVAEIKSAQAIDKDRKSANL